jgi:hypothetical protein
MTFTTEFIAEQLAIAAKATQGPYYGPHLSDDLCSCDCGSIISDQYFGAIVVVGVNNGKDISHGGNDSPPIEEAKTNGLFISGAMNNYPAALQEILRLRAIIEAGPHGPFCHRIFHAIPPVPCDCWKSQRDEVQS